jgi:acetyltransferase
MITRLKSYKIIEGVRGQEGLNQELFAEIITKVSALCLAAPEIAEMDINPLMGNMNTLKAVDARIRIEK